MTEQTDEQIMKRFAENARTLWFVVRKNSNGDFIREFVNFDSNGTRRIRKVLQNFNLKLKDLPDARELLDYICSSKNEEQMIYFARVENVTQRVEFKDTLTAYQEDKENVLAFRIICTNSKGEVYHQGQIDNATKYAREVFKRTIAEKKVEEQLIKIHKMAKIGSEDAIIMHQINNYVGIAKSNLELLNRYWEPIALLLSILRTMPRLINEMETEMIKTGENPNIKLLEDYWTQAKLIIEKNGDENTKKNIELITGKIHQIKTDKAKQVQKLKIFWEETIEKEIEKILSKLPGTDELIQDMPPTIEDAGRGLGKIIQIIRNIKKRAREKTFHPEHIDVFEFIREAIWASSTEPNFRELFYNKTAAITLQLNDNKPITITKTDSMDKITIIKDRAQVEEAFSRAGVLGKLFLMADGGQLEQVFSILFGNAAYAMKEKSEQAKLSISAREEGENVIIDIEDNGKGMSREISEKIFELCFTTKGEKGNGLGLTVALNFINQHQGKIEVRSEEHKYTRFTITLPQKIDGRGQRSEDSKQ